MNIGNQDIRVAIVLELIERLRRKGSWCGETHIQKTSFMLKAMSVSEIDYDFILYKHGPYSFDLHGEISVIRNANLISLVVLQDRYGPSFEVTQIWGKRFIEKHSSHIKRIGKQIDFVVEWVGDRDVKFLERISTALMIKREEPALEAESRAEILNQLKPHISLSDAENATRQVDQKLQEARRLKIA